MKTKFRILITFLGMAIISPNYAQDATISKIQFQETPIEGKLSYTAWRIDYYICTGIAYAKSMGQSVEDFAEFVGKHHHIGDPKTATLASVAHLAHFVMTCYPGGKVDIVAESDSMVVLKSNKPYKDYYKDGPMLGVTLDEFEKYLFGHVAIMASKLNMDFKYEIKEDEVIQTLTYKK